jgi:hypothetical protein
MSKPQPPQKLVQYLLLFAFAAQPVLLFVFVPPNGRTSGGPSWLPIVLGALSGAASLYWLTNRMDPDQSPANFQTNLLIALAFAEIPSLMGIFLAWPAGLSPLPFIAGTILLDFFALLRLNSYWSAKS